jgi:hypothetical protein
MFENTRAYSGFAVDDVLFRWKAGPATITSTIRRVELPGLIAWTGKTLGISAIHYWWLEPRNGTTFVRRAVSYDGLVARLFRRRLQRAFDDAPPNGPRDLNAEAERGGADQR